MKINTLENRAYEAIQQHLIDALDDCDYVHVKGKGENRTDIRINLVTLENPSSETRFFSCGADDNIPVGEVFTSPKLKGTTGLLHVSEIILDDLKYMDLRIDYEDGYIKDYACSNFEDQKVNRDYVSDNLISPHTTLPMGEFAIGTNTLAYMVAKKYGITNQLDILITEKMGPHFAIGDTCYSEIEDIRVYNNDGKEIVAKDNEHSILRLTDEEKAYTD